MITDSSVGSDLTVSHRLEFCPVLTCVGRFADSDFVGWQVGSNSSIYSATNLPSSLVNCTFQDDDSADAQHGEHAVIESFSGAAVRTERCSFSLADGMRLRLSIAVGGVPSCGVQVSAARFRTFNVRASVSGLNFVAQYTHVLRLMLLLCKRCCQVSV